MNMMNKIDYEIDFVLALPLALVGSIHHAHIRCEQLNWTEEGKKTCETLSLLCDTFERVGAQPITHVTRKSHTAANQSSSVSEGVSMFGQLTQLIKNN